MGFLKPVNHPPLWLQRYFSQVNPLQKTCESVTIYTILTALMRMKPDFGFESMLEYMETYLRAVETHDPQMRLRIEKALYVINLHKSRREVEQHA